VVYMPRIYGGGLFKTFDSHFDRSLFGNPTQEHVCKTLLYPVECGYFPMPALKYVRGDFYQFMADTLNSQSSRERGIFDRTYLDRLLAEPEKHFTRLNGSKLWHSALLEYWLQQNIG
jgi:hypothetical protein